MRAAWTVRTTSLLADHGVVVVAVHPGWIRTDMGGPEATTEPAEAAAQLVGLIDALSSDHSGQFLRDDVCGLPPQGRDGEIGNGPA